MLSFFSSQKYKWLESVSIFAAVLLATTIQAVCAYGKDRQFLMLHSRSLDSQATVIRGQYGTATSIPATDLVVGDVIKLQAGDRVPADCVLFEEQDIFVDERELLTTVEDTELAPMSDTTNLKFTEKQCLDKQNRLKNPDMILLKDTLIMAGSGRALVLCVGDHTLVEKERIIEEFKTDDKFTPL